MKTAKEIITKTLLEETPFTKLKCEQIAEKITKNLGMEKTKIIEGKDFKPSQTLLTHLLDSIPKSPFIIGEVEEEQSFAKLAEEIGGTKFQLRSNENEHINIFDVLE